MSKISSDTIICPSCNAKKVINFYASVNVSINPELKNKVINNEINNFLCEKCGHRAELTGDFIYNDMDKKFVILLRLDGVKPEEVKLWQRYKELGKVMVVKDREELVSIIRAYEKEGAPGNVAEFEFENYLRKRNNKKFIKKNNTKNVKILILSLLFYIVGIVIMFGMWKLWSWLFSSNFWRTLFNIITFLGAIKYFWQHTNWTIKQFKK